MTISRVSPSCGEPADQLFDLGVVHLDLVRTDDAEPVVGPAVGVTGHEVVHRLAAPEDQLDDHLERKHAADRGERVVLTDRVAGDRGALVEDAVLAQLGDLGQGERRHRDLGELRQVQHTERMAVHLGIPVGGRTDTTVGLSRTIDRIENPRCARVWRSARSQTSRAAADRS